MSNGIWGSEDSGTPEVDLSLGFEAEWMDSVPLRWKGLVFWGRMRGNRLVGLESYGRSDGGYCYKLWLEDSGGGVKSREKWRLELWGFGDVNPRVVLSEHPSLSGAGFTEMVAAMGLLIVENTKPWDMADTLSPDAARLSARWKRWLSDLPPWLSEDETMAVASA
jgi:hypothetical protein